MSLSSRILQKAAESLRFKTADMLFKKSDLIYSGIYQFYLHYYNGEHYEGDSPPKLSKCDPLTPPYPKGTFVDELKAPAGHFIKINKNMVYPGHIVIPTSNSLDKQGQNLNDCDFYAFETILQSFGNNGIGYYNSGIESGCSQMHKHIQYIPLNDNPIFKFYQSQYPLPYKYFSLNLPNFSFSSIKLGYHTLMDQFSSFGKTKNINNYNFILSRNTAVLIPRKQARHPLGITVNSLGFCGHLFLWEKDKRILNNGAMCILKDLGVENKHF